MSVFMRTDPRDPSIPDLSSVAVCSPSSSTLRAASRWPAAMPDVGCAQRLAENWSGQRNGPFSRTEKHECVAVGVGPLTGGRIMMALKEVFVGIDVAKLRNAVAIADAGRDGEIRYLGEFDASPESMTRLIRKLATKHDKLHFCYEAGPTGYGLHRRIVALGHDCIVVAPSLIPRRAGDRVKTNRRDAQSLARLLRAGELTAVWGPDETHEAVRDLGRTRAMAVEDYRLKRQHGSACV